MEGNNIKIFGKRLKKVLEGLETMKAYGLDDDILISWLCHKTKLPKKDVILMIKSQDEFYHRLLNKDIIDGLKDDKS